MAEKEEKALCPIHNKPLVIRSEPGRKIAVCECDPADNRWHGKPVWTKLTGEPAEEPKKEEK